MLLAYVDESSRTSVTNGEKIYAMGALVVNESQTRAIENGFDNICSIVASKVKSFDPGTEIHAYDVYQGQGPWSIVPPALRARTCVLASKVIANSGANFALRAINVDNLKAKYLNPYPEHQLALSQALEEIEKILTRAHLGRDLALVLADEHHTAPDSRTRFKSLRQHAVSGQTSIPLNHLMDTIYFGPSNHSRILQAVDVATFFKLKYNHSTESHLAAKKSMIKIKQNINKVCCFDYIWP